MAVIVIKGKNYSTNKNIVVDSVLPLNKSFMLKQGDYYYGYAVCHNTIIPVFGLNSDFKNSAIGLSYKGKRFGLLFDDINQEAVSGDFELEDFLKEIIDWEE